MNLDDKHVAKRRRLGEPEEATRRTEAPGPGADQRQWYDEFLSSPHLISRILDIADDAVISVDESQRIVMFNQGAEKIFGFASAEVLGSPLDVLLPDRFAEPHRAYVPEFGDAGDAARKMGERGEIIGKRKSGEEFPAEASISKVDIAGVRIFTVILRDISDRKAAENRIREALREKEVLLKEIHHRVKNNLQVVSSLLSLQSRGVKDEPTRQMFKESRNRVQSMALIHEQLYEARDLADLDFSEYIGQLAAHLFRSYRVSTSRVELKTNIQEVHLGVDAAVPCGLILNELVSNSLKYAFPDGREGEISIELFNEQHAELGNQVVLCVRDNGIGLPADIDLRNLTTLGLRLVRSLVRQLGGHMAISAEAGTQVRISLSPDNEAKE